MAEANAVPVSGSKLDNRRVLAALIDLALVAVGAALIMAAAGVLGQSDVGTPLTAVMLGWALYYYFACESGAGQTLGKRVMNIRVVGTDGAPAGMREIGLRTVLRVIDGLFGYLVGLIVMLATGERRGRLGDLIAHTMIVEADAPAPAAAPARTETAAEEPRVPIAESGPAFEPTVEADQPAEETEADFASPSLRELAADVTAVTESEDRELEEEPAGDEDPAFGLEEEPVVVLDEQPAFEADEEPVVVLDEEPAFEADEQPEEAGEEAVAEADAEADEEPVAEVTERAEDEVTVKSVAPVSAMDIVMGGADQEAVDEQHAKARQG